MKDFIRSVMAVAFLMLMAGIAFGGYTFYDAYQAKRIFAPAPPPTAHEIQIAAFDAWVWFGVKASMQVAIVLGVYWAALRFLWVPTVKAREEIRYDKDTGMLPVVRRNVAPMWKRMIGHNEYDEFDGNLSVAPHRKVYSNGHMSVTAEHDGIDPITQAEYARGTWGVQGSIARKGKGMTVAETKMLSGEASEKARLARTRADVAEMRLRQMEQSSPDVGSAPLIEVSPNPALSLEMALARSTPGRIEIGQCPVGIREIAAVEFDIEPFVLVAGRTRMGKTTSVAFELVLACLYWGWPVTVFEPPEKRDWRNHFGNHINHHVVSSDNAVAHMEMILAEYKRRSELMDSQNIINWQDAPDVCPPWVVVIEEFGALRESFLLEEDEKAGKGNLARFDSATKVLVKRAANTGLIIIGVDQYPDKYNPSVRGAFSKVAFYMGGQGLGNIVDSPRNHKINGTRGVFDRGNIDENENPIFYEALHAESELKSFLPRIRIPRQLRLLSHHDCFGEETQEKPNENPRKTQRTQEKPNTGGNIPTSGEGGNIKNSGGGIAAKTPIPPSLRRAFEKTRRWDDFCEGYFKFYPDARPIDLKRSMADVDNTGRDYTAFNGEGSRQWHRWSPNGDPAKAERT